MEGRVLICAEKPPESITERDPVGRNFLCCCGFEHNKPDEVVDDAKSEDLLADVVRRFGAKNLHFHSRLEVVDICLDSPALEVKLGDFLCRILFVIEQGRDYGNDRSAKSLLSNSILNFPEDDDIRESDMLFSGHPGELAALMPLNDLVFLAEDLDLLASHLPEE